MPKLHCCGISHTGGQAEESQPVVGGGWKCQGRCGSLDQLIDPKRRLEKRDVVVFTYKLVYLSCVLMILHPTSQLVFAPTRWRTFCDSLISPPTISESFVLLFNPPSLEEHMCAAIQIYDNNNNKEKSSQMNRRFVTVGVFIPKGEKATASRCRFCLWCIGWTQREAAKHQIQIAWTCLHRALPACRPPGPLKPRTLR